MSSTQPSAGHKLELTLATPDLQSKIDTLSLQMQQMLEAQQQSLVIQKDLLDCAKAQSQQHSSDMAILLSDIKELLSCARTQKRNNEENTTILASHIAVSGLVPGRQFDQAEHAALCSHLNMIFATEPAAFGTDERKRAFAYLHLSPKWRESYDRYAQCAYWGNSWATLSRFIEDKT